MGEWSGQIRVREDINGQPVEIEIWLDQTDTTVRGLIEASVRVINSALHQGVLLEGLAQALQNGQPLPEFETDDPGLRWSRSVVDYAVIRVALDYGWRASFGQV